MMQLELPIDLNNLGPEREGHKTQSISQPLAYWVEGNQLLPGQAFRIWSTVDNTASPSEWMSALNNVFSTAANVQKAWPWCTTSCYTDQQNGTVSIVGYAFSNASEMLVYMIEPTLVNSLNTIVSGVTSAATGLISKQASLSMGLSISPTESEAQEYSSSWSSLAK